MSPLVAMLLGIVQGLTEFLPISSSGHLVLAQHILNVNPPAITLEIFLHFGTLLAILLVFRADVLQILKSTAGLLRTSGKPKREDPFLRLLGLLLLGTIPVAVVGIVFKDRIENFFEAPRVVAGMLIVTGIILASTNKIRMGRRGVKKLNIKDGIGIGLAQAIALIPGISRSGTTIAAGLFRGLTRSVAVRFSFLLAIPAILGATIVGLKDVSSLSIGNARALAVGTLTAFISGLIALKILLAVVQRGRLGVFAYYCWALGLIALIYSPR